ncbi:hypothetical protein BDY19DRAFT_998734 [Irpex rosettiformis]|uniref:Uncharacterized protein n=1 Tax=Irpex rosettiformis TaxID=378272 RepID=A0ACB8TMI2_9APHY|nr:hypothetical protein BDY19DRAFT_998734 [Irpex rosettiformis]
MASILPLVLSPPLAGCVCSLVVVSLSLSPTIPPSFLVVVLSSAIIIIPLASTSLFSSASSFPASLSFFLLVAIDSTFALYRVHSRTLRAVLKSLSTPTMPRTNPRVAKEIRLQRRLPKSFDDAVQARRDLGEPRLFTEKELDAVVSYVSRRPRFNPYGTPSMFNHEEHNTRTAAANSHYRAECEKTLLERIERHSLQDRISTPAASTSTSATPIVEKHSTIINFKKLGEKDLVGIFKPKLEATIKRLNIVVELLDSPLIICSHRAHKKVVGVHKFFKQTLEDLDHYISTTKRSELQDLNYGLQAIGNISFKSLRAPIDTSTVTPTLNKIAPTNRVQNGTRTRRKYLGITKKGANHTSLLRSRPQRTTKNSRSSRSSPKFFIRRPTKKLPSNPYLL